MAKLEIFNTLVEFFEEDDWSFEWLDGTSILKLDTEGYNGEWICLAQARDDESQFVFYSVFPDRVPYHQRQRMAEFITRANFGLILGCFEMDFDDGELRLRTSIDVTDDELTVPLIRQIVYANLVIMDRYYQGIERVMDTADEPADIVNDLEDTPLLDADDFDDDYDDDLDDSANGSE